MYEMPVSHNLLLRIFRSRDVNYVRDILRMAITEEAVSRERHGLQPLHGDFTRLVDSALSGSWVDAVYFILVLMQTSQAWNAVVRARTPPAMWTACSKHLELCVTRLIEGQPLDTTSKNPKFIRTPSALVFAMQDFVLNECVGLHFPVHTST